MKDKGPSPVVEPVKRKPSLSDEAYEAVKGAIAKGNLEPGDWLREETLGQQLGVSRITLRDALNRLVAEGLAVRVAHRGVKVAVLPLDELIDIYEMRIQLEGMAVELAAQRITEEELDLMRSLLPSTGAASDPEIAVPSQEANREFHMIAIRASRRRQLCRVLGQLLDMTFGYMRLAGGHADGEQSEVLLMQSEQVQAILESSANEHAQLVDALSARDGARAKQVITGHIRHTLNQLIAKRDGSD